MADSAHSNAGHSAPSATLRVEDGAACYAAGALADVSIAETFVRLGDCAAITKGKPPTSIPYAGSDAVVYLTPEYLRGRASAVFAKPYADAVHVADGDAVLLWDGSNAGEFFRGKRGVAASTMARIVTTEFFDRSYFVHALRRFEFSLKGKTHGTGIPHVDREILEQIQLYKPTLTHQCVIAKVLDTLDTTIRQTEAIIAKLKQVKQGLLHDLLTRGIDANGELRPPQCQAPHLYKLSPLGWIPNEWECKPFGELCESSAFGPRFPSDAYDENGPLATLRTTDMDDEGNISLSTMPRAALEPSTLADHLLKPGDIVISRSGTCGVTGVFAGHDIPVVPGAFLIRFRLRDVRLNTFYRRYFNSALGRPLLERLAVGGVQKNIKGSDVLNLIVPTPVPAETVAIAERIEASERDIDINQDVHAKLTREKSGLMDDLLTGRVRVTPLLEPAATP